jgi:predicted SprT family Zn-dependent metalloprotease
LLNVQYERLLVQAVGSEWQYANWSLFREAMRMPILAFDDAKGRLGSWQQATRRLTLARELVHNAPWVEVVDVLYHEMAHQYVDEVLRVTDETPHGAAFQRVCRQIGLVRADAPADAAVLDMVRTLFALAGSANQNEAETAARAAQRLLLKHNLANKGMIQPDGYTSRVLWVPRARHAAWEKLLIGLVSEHFFVSVVRTRIVDRDHVVITDGGPALRWLQAFEAHGTPANLEIADYVVNFVAATGERLWAQHKHDRGVTADRDRQRFLSGVMVGFGAKLREGRAANAKEGLVWVRDGGLDDFVARRFPQMQSGGKLRLTGGEAYRSGQEAGRTIVLQKPITSGPSGSTRLIE